MAIVKKYGFDDINNILSHCETGIQGIGDMDNYYSLLPDRGMSAYSYFRERISDPDIYLFKHKEIKPLCGWVITLPEDVMPEKEEEFFQLSFAFLNERYGAENCVQAVVHKDESGKSHMHYLFVPVVARKKMSANHKERYKICANEVINRKELRDFHPALDQYLSDHDSFYSVHTKTEIAIKTKIEEYIRELETEIGRCISWTEQNLEEPEKEHDVTVMKARIEALTEVKNDLQGRLNESV